MIKTLLVVGAGSFAGGICRHLLQQLVQRNSGFQFPMGTLLVNVSGCFVAGLLFALLERNDVSTASLRLLMITGFCGGYTTFSAFALENILLMKQGQVFTTLMYVLVSVVLGLIAVWLGMMAMRVFR